MPSPPLLDEILRIVVRRYRLLAEAASYAHLGKASAAPAMAMAIEHARQAKAHGELPDARLQQQFIDTLARMIHEAMRTDRGDPAFQTMVLRHGSTQVHEFASLSVHADRDRRRIRAAVNALAHPGKLQRRPTEPGRDALARLHAAAVASQWSKLRDIARRLIEMRELASDTAVVPSLKQLLDGDALRNLERLDDLASDELVLRYQTLWDRHGPRSGSHEAVAQGSASKRRGADVEAMVAQVLTKLAQRLGDAEGASETYRIVTSMHVPASIPADADRAKSEWDVVLLRQTETIAATPVWDVCLLVEAKASVDAATTDLPRLLRGLRLLGHADQGTVYDFETQQGIVRLRGASLRAMAARETDLAHIVLYCCDAPDEPTPPRLLSAASRMQLLSATASLDFACQLRETGVADIQILEPVWHQLLESSRWRAVLGQYLVLRQARELMVHVDDLSAAIDTATNSGSIN
jgi:hypothetical protein